MTKIPGAEPPEGDILPLFLALKRALACVDEATRCAPRSYTKFHSEMLVDVQNRLAVLVMSCEKRTAL